MRQFLLRAASVVMGCALLVACSGGEALQRSSPDVVTVAATLPAPGPMAGAPADGTGEYRLGAQDLLEISVLGVPDLSRTVRVDAAGTISVPLAGTFQAGGKTLRGLEQEIADRLRQSYLQDPHVSVFVEEYASQRVTVEGSVKKPGVFPILGQASLLQAIALAEGLDPLADLQGVVVFRMVEGQRMAAVFDIKAIRGGRMPDPPVFGGDTIVVEQSGSKTVLRRFIETVPVLAIFAIF